MKTKVGRPGDVDTWSWALSGEEKEGFPNASLNNLNIDIQITGVEMMIGNEGWSSLAGLIYNIS